jgi:trans-aconitate methyltransferase
MGVLRFAGARPGRECVNGTLDRALNLPKAKESTVVVDFGTGPGHALAGLSARFGAAVGVDISPALVATANKRAAQLKLSANTVALVSDLSKGTSIRPAIVKACKAAKLGALKVNFGVW